jgi:hypothetical protein
LGRTVGVVVLLALLVVGWLATLSSGGGSGPVLSGPHRQLPPVAKAKRVGSAKERTDHADRTLGTEGDASNAASIEVPSEENALLPPAAEMDPEEIVSCDRPRRQMTRRECHLYQQTYATLDSGTGGVDAPKRMVRGETKTVTFAIIGDETPGGQIGLADVLGREPSQRAERLAITPRMAARLLGEGFKVEPADLQVRDLGFTQTAKWDWRVTALKAPRHEIIIDVFLLVPRPGGESSELLRSARVEVVVAVTRGQMIADFLDDSEAWLTRGTNWLTVLSLFLGALFALLVAVRKFRKRAPRAEQL